MKNAASNVLLIIRLDKYKINKNFLNNYSIESLMDCCNRIEEKNIDPVIYETEQNIQEELIRSESFLDYLIRFIEEGITSERITSLVRAMQEQNLNSYDYPVDVLLEVLKNSELNTNTYCDYLRYFSGESYSQEQQKIIADNLYHFHMQDKVSFSILSLDERRLFLKPFMSVSNLIPTYEIKKICEFLISDSSLMDIIMFLCDIEIYVELRGTSYENIHKNSSKVYGYMQDIYHLLQKNSTYMNSFMEQWVENGCSVYDLKVLISKVPEFGEDEIQSLFQNRVSYINFIFGNKLSNFPLEDVYGHKESLLIYSISNGKKRFLKLIEENIDLFLSIGSSSLLYNEVFYSKYINLNTLNIKDLADLKNLFSNDVKLDSLQEGEYTFREIKALSGLKRCYMSFYNRLLSLKVDNRLLIIRQLTKKDLLPSMIDDESIEILAEKLIIKPLYDWRNDFLHIQGITPANLISILISYEKIERFISGIKNQVELIYILRNQDLIQGYNDLDSIKNNIRNIDVAWNELSHQMGFDEAFIKHNSKNITQFLLKNGSEIALTYYNDCSQKQKKSYKLIIKSELMGKFNILKYHAGDLQKELDYPVSDSQVKKWANCLSISDDIIHVKEYDDFYNTMLIGETPQHTCLSYKNGSYKNCLLSCFDSNKKVLYATINEQIVGRAIIRLTKGSYNGREKRNEPSLSFVDLEKIKKEKSEKNDAAEECLVLFLERSYTAGVSPETELQIKKFFIEILEKKAILLNATLVLSNSYADVNENFVRTKYHLYISKSKAGSQYLDSLNGSATVEHEGSYRSSNFMIKRDDLSAVLKN